MIAMKEPAPLGGGRGPGGMTIHSQSYPGSVAEQDQSGGSRRPDVGLPAKPIAPLGDDWDPTPFYTDSGEYRVSAPQHSPGPAPARKTTRKPKQAGLLQPSHDQRVAEKPNVMHAGPDARNVIHAESSRRPQNSACITNGDSDRTACITNPGIDQLDRARVDLDSPEGTTLAREIIRQQRPGGMTFPHPDDHKEGHDWQGISLFRLARSFISAFGKIDPARLQPFVREWHDRGSTFREAVIEAENPDPRSEWLETWARFLHRYESVRIAEGDAWAAAVQAIDDDSLDCGILTMDCRMQKKTRPKVERLARLFRWLSRFHGSGTFHLPCHRMKTAVGLESDMEAGRLAWSLQKLGFLECVEKGEQRSRGRKAKATEWRWIGPA